MLLSLLSSLAPALAGLATELNHLKTVPLWEKPDRGSIVTTYLPQKYLLSPT